jgi:hypothetical protein
VWTRVWVVGDGVVSMCVGLILFVLGVCVFVVLN